MEIDVDELSHDCSEDVELTPCFSTNSIKVELSHDHVDVVEVSNGEGLKAWVLAAFAVDLEDDVLLS